MTQFYLYIKNGQFNGDKASIEISGETQEEKNFASKYDFFNVQTSKLYNAESIKIVVVFDDEITATKGNLIITINDLPLGVSN